MGMSTNIVGFKPPDEKWRKMKAISDACLAAGVSRPPEVNEFFEYIKVPDGAGVQVELNSHECCREFKAAGKSGFEIDITKLPKDVTIIRFWNGY